MSEIRTSLVDYLRRELIGPESQGEILDESPTQRYSAGVLFPSQQLNLETDTAREDESPSSAPETELPVVDEEPAEPKKAGGKEERPDAVYDDTVLLANSYFPSATGLSFLIDKDAGAVEIHAEAATYESQTTDNDGKKRRKWQRAPLTLKPIQIVIQGERPEIQERALAENLRLKLVSRPRSDGTILVTVSMFNALKARAGDKPPSATESFFQTGFMVRQPDGRAVFREYVAVAKPLADPEEASLAVLYRTRRQYAVGHGCAADWAPDEDARTTTVRTESMPAVIVPPVEPRSGPGPELNMHHLAGLDGSNGDAITASLKRLAGEYLDWIEEIARGAEALEPRLREAARRHVSECRMAHARITSGIALLADRTALRAFMLANRAMLMQQYHSRLRRRPIGGEWQPFPSDYRPVDDRSGRWRTFQLAFVLMNLSAFAADEPDDIDDARSTVDLIWFPTGGGKTEAYLGLTAFAIFMRRLRRPDNGGCTVLMRYTLRLLTAQQFQRASSLICACELIRQENESRLGAECISIGLWVGSSVSPNKREEAVSLVNRMSGRKADEAENKFQILTCPWCATEMDNKERLGYKVSPAEPKTVRMVCPNRQCPFSTLAKSLPILVIDEDIYDSPPTLLIGTVDKFAMLTFRPDAKSIFGIGTDNDPPDLIIQDELHLISGPLGSMVGLYESVIDYLCSTSGTRPKIVASTATIRRAREQCRNLYDRETFQFPPAGIDISDSFFAKENRDSPGRLYVGVFASASPSPVTALVRTASGLLQGAKSIPLPSGMDESARDPYWTLLQYFGSLRELGRAATLVEQDIPEYIGTIARRNALPREAIRRIGSPVELTSRLNAQEIPETLERLKVAHKNTMSDREERPIDTLLATNMISVGVDVDRLGLMAVIGQPKTTSEYIQASSRVGRSAKAPGLVITLYNSGKPRDRSHFEQFRAYHSAFYKHVEPTSVTPFAAPVLERALHALIVIVARAACGVERPDAFDKDDPRLATFLRYLEDRANAIDPEHAPEVTERCRQLVQQWSAFKPGEWGGFDQVEDRNRLMYPAGAEERSGELDDDSWSTPTSMRNVDVECAAKVVTIYRDLVRS